MRRPTLFYLILVAIASLTVGLVVASRFDMTPASGAAPQIAAQARRAAEANPGIAMDTNLFRNIAKQENPIVVSITTQSRVRQRDLSEFSGPDDLFRHFFGGPGGQTPQMPQRDLIQRALGSGFIITKDGDILTNNHVVEGAEKIQVALFENDTKTYQAKVVGRDPLSDSALIHVENAPANLPTASLGDSTALEPGDWVMAIGNPFSFGHTVTVGVVSYKGRPFPVAEGRWQNMIQTDAAINPGNSGGPLINTKGEVVGINTAIIGSDAGGGGNIGIGFAVPIDTVKTLLPQLRKGKVVRGRIGVQIGRNPITEAEAKGLGLPKPEGAIVSQVEHDSPAEKAGIQPGDVIVEFGGKAVPNSDTLVQMVTATAPGSRVPARLIRNGKETTVTVAVEELQIEDQNASREARDGGASFGLSLSDVTPDIARRLRLPPGTTGALIEDVDQGSPAADAGVQRGDVILQVNRRDVRDASDAARELRRAPAGQPVFLLISRRGSEVFLTMRKE